ncbi:MAG: ABC transporter permease subunit [Spirochaetales bacterium]
MLWFRISALIRKDLKDVLKNPSVLVPTLVLPVVLCGLIPLGFTLALLLLPTANLNLGPLEGLLKVYPVPTGFSTGEAMLFIMLNYSFVPMFLMVPVMGSVIMASQGIVGEKEHKTLETLLYTPLTNEELLVAKVLGPLLLAEVLSFVGFALFFVGSNAVWLGFKGFSAGLIVRDLLWIPVMLIVVPVVNALALGLALLVSLKAKTFVEAQQKGGMIMLPLVALLYLIGGGVVIVNAWLLAAIALVAGAGGYALLRNVAPKLTREELTRSL